MHILEALAIIIAVGVAIVGMVAFLAGGISISFPRKIAQSVLLIETLVTGAGLMLVGIYKAYTAAQTDDVTYFFTGAILLVVGLAVSFESIRFMRKIWTAKR